MHRTHGRHRHLDCIHHETARQHGETLRREPLEHAHDGRVRRSLPETLHDRYCLHCVAPTDVVRDFPLREGQLEVVQRAERLQENMEDAVSSESENDIVGCRGGAGFHFRVRRRG